MTPDRIFDGALTILFFVSALFIWLTRRSNKRLEAENNTLTHKNLIIAAKYDEMELRAKSYFDCVIKAQNERDRWRELYNNSSLAAGNAQNRMMVERSRNMKLLTDAGLKPYRDAVIDQLVGAFNEQHYEPVRRSVEENKKETAG